MNHIRISSDKTSSVLPVQLNYFASVSPLEVPPAFPVKRISKKEEFLSSLDWSAFSPELESPDTSVLPPLDIYASSVANPSLQSLTESEKRQDSAVSIDSIDPATATVKDAISCIENTETKLQRKNAYKALGLISKHKLASKRVCDCGNSLGGYVEAVLNDKGGISYGKVETCASVHSCPVCRRKIKSGYREELRAVLDHVTSTGNYCYMLTLTCQHNAGDRLADLYGSSKRQTGFLGAWRKFNQARQWKDTKSEIGLLGYVRAMEETWSPKNGWHVHSHILLFTNTEIKDLGGTKKKIFNTWSECSLKAGLRMPDIKAIDLQGAEFAANYISKWGADSEIIGTNKHATKGSFSIEDFEQMLWDKDKRESAGFSFEKVSFLIQERSKALKGKRFLTWSQSLKELRLEVYGEEKTDEELAHFDYSESSKLVCLVKPKLWWQLQKKLNCISSFKTLLEDHGRDGAREFIDGFLYQYSDELITDQAELDDYCKVHAELLHTLEQ